MKIASIVASYWPAFQFGGTIVSVHHLNRGLVQVGDEVTVFTTNVGLEHSVVAGERSVVDGVDVIYCGYNHWLEILGPTGWQFSWSLVRTLIRELKNFDVAMIHGLWSFPMIAAACLCRWLRIPIIWHLHGQFYPETLQIHWWKKFPVYWLIVRHLIKGASVVRFTSRHEQENCEGLLPTNTSTVLVPLAIDLQEFTCDDVRVNLVKKIPYLATKKIVLFLGRLSWKKGLDKLIPAFANIATEFEDAHLLIVGGAEGGYDRTVKSLLSKYGLAYVDLAGDGNAIDPEQHVEARVTLTGALYGADRVAAYRMASVFVLPSYSENFAITVLEAMAAEVPIIVSEEVGLAEEVRAVDAGIVVAVDVDILTVALRDLLGDAKRARTMGKNGLRAIHGKLDYQSLIMKMHDVSSHLVADV